MNLFRFTHSILKTGLLANARVLAANPIPVRGVGGDLVGFAVLEDIGRFVSVRASIDPARPERLDLEVGERPYWLDASVSLDLKTGVFFVSSVSLTSVEVEGQEKIDGKDGELA